MSGFIPAGAGNTSSSAKPTSPCAVHPRWRGEHTFASASRASICGSSPLARGTLAQVAKMNVYQRFIPAGAGNTSVGLCAAGLVTVHPRWRGEHRSASGKGLIMIGSSPLARGTLVTGPDGLVTTRFIPAGAGNTSLTSISPSSPTVHPRWRGEHVSMGVVKLSPNGSSPLARGTHVRLSRWRHFIRFIPAGAGNTWRLPDARISATVHPRWRGEHFPHSRPSQCALGSSPLARGTRPVLMPAWSSSPVHPRWRGEHFSPRYPEHSLNGSSPLARGTPGLHSTRWSRCRFIPAGAGNTVQVREPVLVHSVHPRWRGEHT